MNNSSTAQKNSLPSYIESIANEVLAKYRRLDSILSHAPSKGTYHEKILRNIVRTYLPSTFTVGEGFVINKDGETSSQLDIIIADNLDPRSFVYKENNFFIATNLSVVSFGEVKTYCTKKEFVKSFHSLVNTSLLLRGDHSARVTSFLFCYDAYASAETFSRWTDEAIKQLPNKKDTNSWNYPDYVFCLKKKIVLDRRPVDGGFQYWHATSKSPKSNIVQQKIMQDLFQCITDGCGRIRGLQGIRLLER